MPKAFFKMSRCRVMNSSSRRSRAISSALVGSLNLKAPGPVCSPIQTSLLQRFKLQTETPSSWLNCWALRSPDFNIATASRLNSSSNRRPFLFVPLFSFFSTVLALNYEHSRLSATSGTPHQYVERAQYEAEQARVRYMRVDPSNRLVADTLEALWNDKLRQLEQAREDYEKQRESGQRTITRQQKAQIMALAEDFPRLWKDPGTSDRDRKRMARLIFEDVTLNREHSQVIAQIRFKGGATKVLRIQLPARAWQLRKTKPEIVAEVDRLLEQCTDSEIAAELNSKGWRSSGNQLFDARMIRSLSTNHKLPSRSARLRAKGLLTAKQIAELIASKHRLVHYWRQKGLLNAIRLNDKNEYLYEHPNEDTIQQIKRRIQLSKPTTYPR